MLLTGSAQGNAFPLSTRGAAALPGTRWRSPPFGWASLVRLRTWLCRAYLLAYGSQQRFSVFVCYPLCLLLFPLQCGQLSGPCEPSRCRRRCHRSPTSVQRSRGMSRPSKEAVGPSAGWLRGHRASIALVLFLNPCLWRCPWQVSGALLGRGRKASFLAQLKPLCFHQDVQLTRQDTTPPESPDRRTGLVPGQLLGLGVLGLRQQPAALQGTASRQVRSPRFQPRFQPWLQL